MLNINLFIMNKLYFTFLLLGFVSFSAEGQNIVFSYNGIVFPIDINDKSDYPVSNFVEKVQLKDQEHFIFKFDTLLLAKSYHYYEDGSIWQKGVSLIEDSSMYSAGIWVTYYRNGNIMKEEELKDGKVHGFIKEYYSNGRIKSEGQYNAASKKSGEWIFYNDKGEVVKRKQY